MYMATVFCQVGVTFTKKNSVVLNHRQQTEQAMKKRSLAHGRLYPSLTNTLKHETLANFVVHPTRAQGIPPNWTIVRSVQNNRWVGSTPLHCDGRTADGCVTAATSIFSVSTCTSGWGGRKSIRKFHTQNVEGG